MQFRLVFKTSDVLDQIEGNDKEEAEKFARKFLKYEEFVSLLFDTEEKTVVVEKIGEK